MRETVHEIEVTPDRLLDVAWQVGHDSPGGLRGKVDRVGGDREVAGTSARAKDELAPVAPLARPIGEDAFEGPPPGLPHPLTWRYPFFVVGADRHDIGQI